MNISSRAKKQLIIVGVAALGLVLLVLWWLNRSNANSNPNGTSTTSSDSGSGGNWSDGTFPFAIDVFTTPSSQPATWGGTSTTSPLPGHHIPMPPIVPSGGQVNGKPIINNRLGSNPPHPKVGIFGTGTGRVGA